ncbi:heterogeneous nuclear ribonucleoprotein 1-like [Typha angustifolia]|uniref:heterogeneous nuclear ribonucleoprotein 1-like n=1 Tax=Typha angustifolia TaxID=59011 RepID=UPI003C2DAAE9
MDSDQGKLFIGGISWDTNEEKLKEYFGNYGEVSQVVIMRDKATGRPRGFGFVVFADPSLLDRVLQDKHTIDGRAVEAKRALSREEQQSSTRSGNHNAGRAVGGGVAGNIRTKKIFVGGLPPTLTEEGFRQYFQNYGNVTDVVVMYDQNTQRPRGFGFISFDTEDAVDHVLHKTFHELNGKLVEVKRALPKDANPNTGGSRSMGGGTYQSYGGSGGNTSSYDGRMDTNRYMQPQAGGGGYPAYGSSGYGAPSYGYGAANTGVGYGGYGVGGYGGAGAGYSGPAGGYGNPNVLPGAPRSPWNNQVPTGYGSAGYGGNAAYGAASSWNNPGSGGAAAAPTGQSPGGAMGYGSQGYGYGGYGGAEGPYGSQGGYGSAGGRGSGGPTNNPASGTGEQGVTSGYSGSGYGDANGSSGYSNAWRDPSQGGPYGASLVNGPPGGAASYGGGYVGGQGRQPQQQ